MEHVLPRQNGTTVSNIYTRSPNIWNRCPLSFTKKFYPEGHVRWDASKLSLAGTQTTQIAGPIDGTKVFSTTALVVDAVGTVGSTVWGGAIRFGSDTDNDSSSLAQAYPTFRMSGLKSSSSPLWFEGCVAQSSLATSTNGWFMGMAETDLWTLATGVPFAGGDGLADAGGGVGHAAAIGFRKEEDGLGVVDTVYTDRAVAFTNIGDAEGSITAVNTFTKFGFFYNPLVGQKDYDSSRIIQFFQNNVALTTPMTKAALTALTYLDAGLLGPIFSVVADSGGTASKVYLKWLEVAQLPPGVPMP